MTTKSLPLQVPKNRIVRAGDLVPGDVHDGNEIVSVRHLGFGRYRIIHYRNSGIDVFGVDDLLLLDNLNVIDGVVL